MCTVTWRRDGKRLDVLFNRDELRTRPPALPPRLMDAGPHRCIAPIDGRAGGTWLAVNDRGLVVGILNFYDGQAAPPPARPFSRGRLVLDQMAHADVTSLRAVFPKTALSVYPAFILLALDPSGGAVFHWDGRTLREDSPPEPLRPLSTSSFDTAAVLAARRARYAELVGDGDPRLDALMRFHADTHPRGGAYSVLMDRDEARTVSFSWIGVAVDQVVFRYTDRDKSYTHEIRMQRAP